MVPYSTEKVVGIAISHFIQEQEPENVDFNVIVEDEDAVGWEIVVETDDGNVEEAANFWQEFVMGRLE